MNNNINLQINFLNYHAHSGSNLPYYRYRLQNTFKKQLASQLEICEYKELDVSDFQNSILSIHIDQSDQRYLLAGSSDMVIAIYDLDEYDRSMESRQQLQLTSRSSSHQGKTTTTRRRMTTMKMIRPIVTLRPNNDAGGRSKTHENSITCVEWYPHDTGMFFTSGYDNYVKVWSTNEQQVALQFRLNTQVNMFSLSPIATQHMNIACACNGSFIRLCDVNSGSSAQTLSGHKGDVKCVRWSPTNEYLLASGSTDQTVKLWDIRMAGWLHSFDMSHTKRRKPLASPRSKKGTPTGRGKAIDNDSSEHRSILNSPKKFSVEKVYGRAPVKPSHQGAIVDLQFSPDGCYLLSSGMDARLLRWEVATGQNTLVAYPKIVTSSNIFHRNFALSQEGSVVFHPNGENIGVYDVESGALLSELQGHFRPVTSVAYHPKEQELYSVAEDRSMMIWTPRLYHEQMKPILEDNDERSAKSAVDEDAWSSDEEDNNTVGF